MKYTFYNSFNVDIPNEYMPMTLEEKKARFVVLIPEYAFINRKNQSSIVIQQNETPLSNEEIPARITAFQQAYSRMAPGFQMGELCQRTLDNQTFGLLTFKSNAPTHDLFNVFVLCAVDGKEVMQMFNCNLITAPLLLNPFLRIAESLRSAK